MRIGILGGTFDPIHQGHTYLAKEVLKIFKLDRVLFMISRLPPHKPGGEISSPFHRYAMVVLALLGQKRLYTSQWELLRGRFSYTVDTLRHFARTQPQHLYCFIAGSDSLKEIHLWKDYDRLLRKYTLIFVQRPGARIKLQELTIPGPLKGAIKIVQDGERPAIQAGQSFLVSLDPPPISSTSIREMIVAGKEPSQRWVSPSVLRYLQKHRLYERNKKRC